MITESGAERFRRGGGKPVRRNAGGWLMQSVTKRSDMDLHMSIDFLHVPPLPTVLLAAGLGTRLTPVTEYLPKCLVPVNGRPLLGYWLDMCRSHGLPAVVNTHYKAETVAAYVRDSHAGQNVEIFHEPELLGTAGTLLALQNRLSGGPFMVVHADNLSFFSLPEFWAAHAGRPRDCLMTMMLFEAENPQSCGIVRVDESGVVTEFFEKVPSPPGRLANAAVYIMEPGIFSVLRSADAARDISLDLLPLCLGRIFTFFNGDYHRDIGTVESYALAQAETWLRTQGR